MKKFVILFLALIIAVPAISHAGAVNNRWDMTIGGMVKFDVGWVDHVNRSAFNSSRPEPRAGQSSNDWNRGTFFMQASETELNFRIKGPDAFGAKTSASIIADFSGGWNSASAAGAGEFNAKVVKMQFDWPTTRLEIGVFPTMNGRLPTYSGNHIGYGMGNEFDKGNPSFAQINLTQRFGKNFSAAFGVIQYPSPAFQGISSTSGRVDSFTEYGVPGVQSFVQYSSDSCGKVGPWGLNFKLGGSYARQRIRDTAQIHPTLANPNVDSYAVDFTWTVPIIPTKQGHNRNALLFAGTAYQFQGAGAYAPTSANFITTADVRWQGYHERGDGDYSRPVINGVMGHLQYWWTDTLSSNLHYGQTHAMLSRRNILASNNVKGQQMIVANIMYDASPAVRFGFEWDNVRTAYTGTPIVATKRHGTTNAFRVGAYYFF